MSTTTDYIQKRLDDELRDALFSEKIDSIAKALHNGGNIKIDLGFLSPSFDYYRLGLIGAVATSFAASNPESRVKIIEYLLMAGIYDTKEEALQELSQIMMKTNYPKVIQFFLGQGCDINEVDSDGDNLLHLAAKRSGHFDDEITILALQNGIYVDAPTSQGTPLRLAEESSRKYINAGQIFEIINRAEKLIKLIDDHKSVDAHKSGKKDKFYLFDLDCYLSALNHKQYGNAINGRRFIDGNTALQLAIETNQHQVVDKLIKAGARTDLPNRNGKTAADMGKAHTNPEIAKHFLEPVIVADENVEYEIVDESEEQALNKLSKEKLKNK